MAFAMLDILCSNPDGRIFSEREHMKLDKWADGLAKSKLSAERRARIRAEVEQGLLEMNLQELRGDVGVTQANVPAKDGRVLGRNVEPPPTVVKISGIPD
jgi:hypothetical protein